VIEPSEPTEAEEKALEAIIRNAHGLALAIERFAKARLKGSKLRATEQNSSAPEGPLGS